MSLSQKAIPPSSPKYAEAAEEAQEQLPGDVTTGLWATASHLISNRKYMISCLSLIPRKLADHDSKSRHQTLQSVLQGD